MKAAHKFLWSAASALVGVAIIGLWQLVAMRHYVSPIFLPSPGQAWAELAAGFRTGSLGSETLATIQRMVYGWVLASLCGVGMGALIGSSRRAREYVAPMLEFIRPLPASAMIPVAIAFFGLSGSMVIGVVAFGSVWPTLLATIHGFAAVEPRLLELGRILHFSRLRIICKIVLPSAMPDILAAMRLGLTIALVLSVVAEILAFQGGLGSHILAASRSYRSAELYAGVLVLGVIGLASNLSLSLLEHWLLRWCRTQSG
jgi:ABC-type nitrate/sulfonate/bicarbonate transport system permease component